MADGLRQRGVCFGVEEIPESTYPEEICRGALPTPRTSRSTQRYCRHRTTEAAASVPAPPKRPREEVAANRTYGQEVPGADFPDGDLATLEPTAPAAAPSATATETFFGGACPDCVQGQEDGLSRSELTGAGPTACDKDDALERISLAGPITSGRRPGRS